jgi:hypothetical protein
MTAAADDWRARLEAIAVRLARLGPNRRDVRSAARTTSTRHQNCAPAARRIASSNNKNAGDGRPGNESRPTQET